MPSSEEKLNQPEADTQMQQDDQVMQNEEQALDQAEDELIEKIRLAEKKAEENWEQLLRARAEMENLRRRTQKDLENAHKYSMEKFVSELLPVKDSMELGLAAEGASAESLREGMELTMNLLSKAFEKLGVTEVNPLNEPFNPELHQAMTMQPSAEVEPNTVTAVMQKGYLLNERLVRPAMVIVSKSPEQ
jgi:molecular chaperone GrpE